MVPAYTIGQALLTFIGVSSVLLSLMMFFSWIIRPQSRETETYECGMRAEGNHKAIGFNYIGYGVLFLVFDLAALYLFLYTMTAPLPPDVSIGFVVGLGVLLLLLLHGTQKRKYYVA